MDILTGGRVVFGIGRGYHTREVESFGAPMIDGDANRELFEEQFEIMMKAFNEESFSHQGKHYTIPPDIPYRGYDLKEVTLVPRPKTRPVDVWQPIVSASDRALDFMAKWGIKGVILGTGEQYVEEWVQRYQAANRRAGRDLALGEGLCIGLWAMVDDTTSGARRQLQPLFEEHVKFAAPLGMLRYSDQQIAATGPGGVARHIAAGTDFQDVIDNRAWFAGSPEDTIAYLEETAGQVPRPRADHDRLPHGRDDAAVQGADGPVRGGGDPALQESGAAGIDTEEIQMAVPTTNELHRPILDIAAETGGALSARQFTEELAQRLDVTEDDLLETVRLGGQKIRRSRPMVDAQPPVGGRAGSSVTRKVPDHRQWPRFSSRARRTGNEW